jgi:hypothetical protein
VSSVVVAVRWGGGALDSASLASRVRGAIERASVSGGLLAGVAADGASFAYEPAEVEAAIDLALSFALEGQPVDGAPPSAGVLWRVGIGFGDLVVVRDLGDFEKLAVGSAASRASALARVAQPGEILVDLDLDAARAGALLATGRRVATDRGKRLRGLMLDVREPWRRGGAVEVERVRVPRIAGREAVLATILEQVQPGGLGVVRASPGHGGSRLLEELAARCARALMVVPAGAGIEPLGALRLALSGLATRRGVPSLPPREAELWRYLAQGEGIEVEQASDLLSSWFSGALHEGERALVLVDDAALVDRASLEALGFAAGAPGATFGLVVRLDAADPMPSPLVSLVVEADITLRALAPHESASVLEDACGGAASVSRDVVKRWVRRGGGIPLAIVESLRLGLAIGELASRDGVVSPRSKVAGRGRTLSPQAWIVRRLAALVTDRPNDATIVALVACAGAIDRALLEEALSDLGVPTPGGVDATLERLAREGLVADEATFVAPANRSLRDAALARLEEPERRRLHGALAAAIARTARGLDLAEGAQHAALAGDHLGAGALAVRAADRARRAGLRHHAESLEGFARAEGAGVPTFATTPSPPPRSSLRSPRPEPAPDDEPTQKSASARRELDDLPLTQRAESASSEARIAARHSLAVGALTEHAIESLPSPIESPLDGLGARAGEASELDEIEIVDELPDVRVPSIPPVAFSPRSLREAFTEDSAPPVAPSRRMPSDSPQALLARKARTALLAGDAPRFEAALQELDGLVAPSALARLRGLIAVSRGDVASGLKLIRDARASAQSEAEVARAALAFAIGLGALGRRDDALLEALDALSIERRTGHREGALACRKVIERLLGAG